MENHDALGEGFCKAQAERLRLLARIFWNVADREALESLDLAPFDGMGEAVERAREAVERDRRRALADDGAARDLRVEYTALFASSRLGAPLPYESLYADGGGLLMQGARDEVRELYRAGGYAAGQEDGEPEDHLSNELRFLAFLYDRARLAQEAGRDAERDGALSEASAFKEGHLDRWVPFFCDRASATAESDFYRNILVLLRSCVCDRASCQDSAHPERG